MPRQGKCATECRTPWRSSAASRGSRPRGRRRLKTIGKAWTRGFTRSPALRILLSWSGEGGARAGDLLEGILEGFSRDRFDLGECSVTLPHEQAHAFALMIYELATNAIKYGALSNETGRVWIECLKEAGRIRVLWKEFGRTASRSTDPRRGGNAVTDSGLRRPCERGLALLPARGRGGDPELSGADVPGGDAARVRALAAVAPGTHRFELTDTGKHGLQCRSDFDTRREDCFRGSISFIDWHSAMPLPTVMRGRRLEAPCRFARSLFLLGNPASEV